MYRFALRALSALFCILASQAISQPQVQLFLPGLDHTPPVELALPSDFIVAPYTADTAPNLKDGVLWGTKQDINHFYLQGAKARAHFSKGLMWVRLSDNISQTTQGGFSHDIMNFKMMGARNIRIEYKRWANLPVMAVECDIGNVHFTQAWVGLNDEGETLHITYLGPGKPSRASKRVWTELMAKTAPLSIEQILGLYGYKATRGQTLYERGQAKMTASAQWARKGKAVVLLDANPNTKITVFQGGLATDQNDPHFCYVELLIDVERPSHEAEQVGRDLCPILASVVDTITLKGDVIFENDHLVVLKPKAKA